MKYLNMGMSILTTWLVMACSNSNQPQDTSQHLILSDSIEVWEDAYNFLVIGDWGRKGDYGQQEVADCMEKVSKLLDAEFVIATGDNFYPDGVASIQDPNWEHSYEDIYSGYHLNIPWHVVLGNHDYRGNPQAEVDYTHISRRWNMPARYFALDYLVDDDDPASGTMSFVFIDTSPFEQKYYAEKKYQSVWDQDTTRQKVWMDSVLTSKNDSEWLFVVGHHPLYSGGKRLDETQQIRSSLEGILKAHGVDAYFAGHEHDLQHIEEGDVHHFISGAGSEVRPTGMMEFSKFAASKHGFMTVSVLKEKALVQVIDDKGHLLYKVVLD